MQEASNAVRILPEAGCKHGARGVVLLCDTVTDGFVVPAALSSHRRC